MSPLVQLEEAVAAVQAATPLRPVIGLVLGSGLGAFGESLEGATRLRYQEIPHFPTSTAEGISIVPPASPCGLNISPQPKVHANWSAPLSLWIVITLIPSRGEISIA